MHRLCALGLVALSSCSVLGPDADGPALLSITGTVEDLTMTESLEVVLTWYVNARPNEPFLYRAERASVGADGRFTLVVRDLPPPSTRLPPVEGAPDAARIAIGFLDLRTPDLDPNEIAADSPGLALVFPGALADGVDLSVGWYAFWPELTEFVPLDGQWTDIVVDRIESTDPFWRPCGLLVEGIVTASFDREEAESMWREADAIWCDNPEDNLAAFSSCARVGDYLCQQRCIIEVRALDDEDGFPSWWPCELVGLACDPARDGDVVSCEDSIDRSPAICDPSVGRWFEHPLCREQD